MGEDILFDEDDEDKVAKEGASVNITPSTSPPPVPRSDSTSASPQMQDAQKTMPSVDGLEDGLGDGRNAWSDEVRDSAHPTRPIPESLRPGPPGGPPHSSQEPPRQHPDTNPYLKKQAQTGEISREESSTDSGGTSGEHAAQTPPSRAPPPIPPAFNGMFARKVDQLVVHILTK